MTKADIVRQIAQVTGLTRTDAAAVVDGFIESVIDALEKGEHIEIRGFGVLGVKDTKPKPAARNPRTGEIVYVPARKKSYFKAGVLIKKALHKPLDAQPSTEEQAPADLGVGSTVASSPSQMRPAEGSQATSENSPSPHRM